MVHSAARLIPTDCCKSEAKQNTVEKENISLSIGDVSRTIIVFAELVEPDAEERIKSRFAALLAADTDRCGSAGIRLSDPISTDPV